MNITGTQLIPAPRDTVWAALNDPVVLKACLPGCESVERGGPDEFLVVVAATVGPLKARFQGSLRFAESQPPASCVMVFEGQGGAVGFGKGTATVRLGSVEGGTELTYTAQAQIGGKLAQIGSRLVDGVARKMADDFFAAFRARLAPTTGERVSDSLVPPSDSAAPAPRSRAAPDAARADANGPATSRSGVLVPAWWLGVAVVLGAAATALGVLLTR